MSSKKDPTSVASKGINVDRYDLLNKIDSPADLRKLPESKLPKLVDQIREFLIDVTSKTGGHLAPGLGAVELTIALHYLYDTPEDRIVWDIGHQAYPHKIITGRRELMHTIRKQDGISGFLKREESIYDCFGAGHSSTSISAAYGMAVGAEAKGESRQVVAVIGDGAMTAGLAYEALNNAGASDTNLLVILNDNEMSISPNVGAVSNYLARILSGRAFMTVREGSKAVLGTLPPVQELTNRFEAHTKGLFLPSTLFEELGFYYIGPIDGHNLPTLIRTIKNMKKIKGPRFLHIITQKGKGFDPAEADPLVYHGVVPFNPDTGKMEKKSTAVTYTKVFSKWLCDMAAKDDRLVGITPAMREGSGLVEFQKQFPDRYFDVGIAEQHSVTFAAGLACEGMKPVVAIYSTFLQRAYDQLIHDVCVQNLDLMFALDRAGYVGGDGATHAGAYDYAYLRCIPNMVVMAPADERECRNMLYTAYMHEGPISVRYPRGAGVGVEQEEEMTALEIGKASVERNGKGTAILSFGSMLAAAMDAGERLNATVVNMRFVKPIDEELVTEITSSHDLIVTIEEHVVAGGAGSAVNEVLAKHGILTRTVNFGLPDEHVDHGVPKLVFAKYGMDADAIVQKVEAIRGLDSMEQAVQ
jgi:1-deoxy-D-xylulose-5-phosphate synthase